MADVNDLLNQAINSSPVTTVPNVGLATTKQNSILPAVENKQESVIQQTATKQSAIATPYELAVGQSTGKGVDTASELETDLRTMDASALYGKYGSEATNMLLNRASGSTDYLQDVATPSRDLLSFYADNAKGIGTGFGNALGGLAALGVGAVDDDAGVAVSGALNDASEFVRDTRTDRSKAIADINAARNTLDERDSEAQYQQDLEEDGEFLAGLSRIGRETVSSVGNAGSDLTSFIDGTVEALGSFAAAGGVGKAVSLGAKALIPTATQRGVGLAAAIDTAAGNASVARSLAKLGEIAPTAAAIGGIEAGGSYQQLVTSIMGRSHEELQDNSPRYRELLSEGMSQEEAKIQVANEAGLEAAATTAPAALAAGTLVSRFTANPLSGGLRHSLADIGKETVEEAIQGGSSQFAQNLAERDISNENINLTEGVGRQVGEGALYGMGMSAALSAPKGVQYAAIASGKKTLSAIERGATKLAGTIADRADALSRANDEASPIADTTILSAANEAATAAPVAEATMREAANALPPEQAAPANAYIDQLMTFTRFDPSEVSASLAPVVEGATNRVQAIQLLADQVASAPQDSAEQLSAAFGLYELVNPLVDSINSDPEAANAIPEDHPAKAMINDYANLMANVTNTPKVMAAIEEIQRIVDKQSQQAPTPVTEQSVVTPQGQEAVRNAATIASVAPEKANLETNEQILYQASQGNIALTPEQNSALTASVVLLKGIKAADAEAARLGQDSKSDLVSREIRTEKGNKGDSLLDHTKKIMSAWNAGNNDLAASRLESLGKFVQHMQNKVAAVNAHFAAGDPNAKGVHYQALGPGEQWFESTQGMVVRPTKEGSVKLMQSIAMEAQILSDVYNGLVDAFPSLNAEHIPATPLDAGLNKPVAQVIAENTQTAPTTQEEEIAPTVSTETTPETTVQSTVPTAQDTSVTEVENRTPEPEVEIDAPVVETEGSVPQTTEEDAQEVSEPEPSIRPAAKGISALYPDLYTFNKNYFVDSFKLPEAQRTRTIGTELPLQVMADAFNSSSSLQNFMGDYNHDFTNDIAEAYQDYLSFGSDLVNQAEDNLQSFLGSKYSKDVTMMEHIENGGDVNRWRRGKALNITEVSDGTLKYNPELIQTASLATLQWLLTGDQNSVPLEIEDVAALTGIAEESISAEILDALSEGLGRAEAKRALADKITQYWGVQNNPNGYIGNQKGIPEAIASEMLRTLESTNAIEIRQVTLTEADGLPPLSSGKPNVKKFDRILLAQFNQDSPLKLFPNAIEQAVLIEPTEVTYIGDGQTIPVAQTQLRNPSVENTEQQKQAIANEQATPYYANPVMAAFYGSLGKANMLKLFAAGDLEGRVLNKNHAKSLDGQNRSVAAAYDHLTNLLAEMSNVGAGTPLDQVPVRYAFNMTRVGRLQMIGRHNPQANKIVREAVLPTRSTLDLNNPEHRDLFNLGLAQALGIKVHKLNHTQAFSDLNTMLEGPLAPAVAEIESWMSGYDPSQALVPANELSDASVNTLVDAFAASGEPITSVALHALTEYVRSKTVTGPFTTPLYVEADGVTNGPINAMVLFTSGGYTAQWVKNIGKGGLYFNRPGETVNSYNEFTDNKDMYQATTDVLKENLANLRQSFIDNNAASAQMEHLLNVMSLFFPDLSFDGRELTLKRGIAKNPLTITIYGSGAGGIAAKLVSAISDAVYERMSAVAEAQITDPSVSMAVAMFGDSSATQAEAETKMKTFADGLRNLRTKRARMTKKGPVFETTDTNRSNKPLDPQEFTFTGAELDNMKSNMQHLFVTPLRDAISSTVGEALLETTDMVRKATQVQSIVLEYAFRTAVNDALEAKKSDPDWVVGDFLTSKELDGIYKSLQHLSPTISTGTQTFYVAGSESSDYEISEFGSGLQDNFRTSAYLYGPKDAGVAGVPFLNIGTGDGQMMQNISVADNAPTGTLKIFDGMNLPLDQVVSGSEVANKAVYDSWSENPLSAVHKSYSQFMKEADLTNISEPMNRALTRALLPPQFWEEGVASENLVNIMQTLVTTLNAAQQTVEARHKVMAMVPTSIDQMAAAASPHIREGSVELVSTTPESLATELNDLYHTELDQIIENQREERDLNDQILSLATRDEGGAYVFGSSDLKQLASKLPVDQREIVTAITDTLAVDNYKLIYGTPDEIHAYKPDAQIGSNTQGFTTPGDRTIYLISGSSETLVHELIHAATFGNVSAYYSGRATPEVAAATKRIESLMDQFMGLNDDLTQLNPEVVSTYQNVVNTVNGHLLNGEKAVALNEFMAWTLANEGLARLTKRVKVSKLSMIKDRIVSALRSMFGIKQTPGTDLFSNLLFNSAILMSSQPKLSAKVLNTTLFQNSTYGNNDRIAQVADTYANTIGQYLGTPIQQGVVAPSVVVSDAIMTSYRIGQSAMAHGFPMTMQEASAFSNIVAALATEARIDPPAMAAAQQLYAHVIKNLKVEDFMADPSSQSLSMRYYAQQKFDFLNGRYLTETDSQGRSTLLPVFLGLATVSDEFRAVLSRMEMPKSKQNTANTLDALLENTGNSVMDSLARRMSGTNNSTTITQAIDALNAHVTDLTQQREAFIDQMAERSGNMIDRANTIIVDGVTSLSRLAVDAATRANQNSANRVVRLVTGLGAAVAGVVNEQSGQIVSQGVMSNMNRIKGWEPLTTLVNDIVGRTKSNETVYDMIKGVRSMVQQVRQQFREHLPETLAGKFSRELTAEEWGTLYRGMGKTDLAVLRDGFTNNQINKLLADPTKLDAEVTKLETFLQNQDPDHFKLLQRKMSQLANYMVNGETGPNLLRNAEAISRLFGERKKPSWTNKNARFVKSVDHLVTMYALQDLSQGDRDTMAALARTEANGLGFSLDYLVGQRADEITKANSTNAALNGFKGYIPNEGLAGVSMFVAKDTEYSKLIGKSYVRVGDYVASSKDNDRSSRGYYFAPVASRAAFEQGIIQNVQQSAQGVDPVTGYSMSQTAGRITEPSVVARISKQAGNEAGSHLMPVYDTTGKVIAYERSLDPVIMERANGTENLAKAVGIWRGRQVEEASSQIFNRKLVDALHDMYQKDIAESSRNENQYVDLFGSDLDPVTADAIGLLNRETREYIEGVFGSEFKVRRDMLNDALGYRSASIGDAWTGNSRWSPKTQKAVHDLAASVFGNNARKTLLTAEKTVQNIVSDARVLIVVKSVVVPMANLMSNVFQMVSRGVPLNNIVRGMGKKTVEIESYVRGRLRQIEAEAELRAATTVRDQRRLTAEIQSIVDSNKRLTIWPLIEAGEFSSISDVGLSREEVLLTSGRLQAYIERQVDKLPAPLATAGRYALVTKDTALFQGLQKSVEYGDFLAKAIIYDDLTIRQKKSKKDALGRVTEEFVNYDRLPGRFRGTLENLGLLWFYNFKIRSTKVALSMIRNNPVHTLLATIAPSPTLFGSVGLPTEDNIFSKLADGTLDYSIGPGQGLHSAMLNPWVNLTQ